jgi:hypothetical protein
LLEGNEFVGTTVMMTQAQMEWLQFIISNYDDINLSGRIKELLDLLALIKSALPFQDEVSAMLEESRNELMNLKDSLTNRSFTGEGFKNILKIYVNSETLKLNLLHLTTALGQDAKAVNLREYVEHFINFLDSVKFFNQEGLKNISDKTAVMYFPFSLPYDGGMDTKASLFIYPEFDDLGKIKQDLVSLTLLIETEHLGPMRISLKVWQKNISCTVAVDDMGTKVCIDDNAHHLSKRLKDLRYMLNNFRCILKDGRDNDALLESPRLELKV